MTQLAAWVGRDRALVGVDTLMTPLEVDPASPFGQQLAREQAAVGNRVVEGSKVLALPHARLLLANVGSGAFLGSVFMACQAQQPGDDFDALDAKMQGILGAAFETLLAQHRAHYAEVSVEVIRAQLILFVGWSASRNRVCATIFQQRPQAEGFVRVPLAGHAEGEDPRGRRFAAPWNVQTSGPTPYADTPELMEQVARVQMRDYPHSKAGGRLLVAELTRDAVSVRSQCELEDRAGPRNSSDPIPPQRQTGAGHAVVFGMQRATGAR